MRGHYWLEYPVYEKLWVVTSLKVGNIDLDAFQKLSIGIRWVINVVTSIVSRWGFITLDSTLVSLSLNILRVSNLTFISANIAAISWVSIGGRVRFARLLLTDISDHYG